MRRSLLAWAGFLMAATVTAAAGQAPDAAPPPATPRLEVGGGITEAIPLAPGGSLGMLPYGHAGMGVRLGARWALEGALDFRPQSGGLTALYSAVARWQFHDGAPRNGIQAHVTMGGVGGFAFRSYPEYRWQDGRGATYVSPAASYWDGSAPMYPTVGIGLTKALGPRVAFRADLAGIVVPFSDSFAVMVLPSVGLSVPIGRIPARTR